MTVRVTLTGTEASLVAMALATKRDADIARAAELDNAMQSALAFTFRQQAEMASRLIDAIADGEE